ncbi:hypothetical protein HK405_003610, partial [Cladochytrium tenue]
VIVVITSNHPEVPDVALIRPSRIGQHLELGYCTQHQIHPAGAGGKGALSELVFPGSGFPQGVRAPWDAMRIKVLYRSAPELIHAWLTERIARRWLKAR